MVSTFFSFKKKEKHVQKFIVILLESREDQRGERKGIGGGRWAERIKPSLKI